MKLSPELNFLEIFPFPFLFVSPSFVLESRAYNKVDDKSRLAYRCQTSRSRGLHATVASIRSGNASKVAEARKLRSRHFPVSAREGRGRRTVDQIHRVGRSHNAIATSMLYKRHSRCMTNVRLKHLADTICSRTDLLISPVRIYETFNSPHLHGNCAIFFIPTVNCP